MRTKLKSSNSQPIDPSLENSISDLSNDFGLELTSPNHFLNNQLIEPSIDEESDRLIGRYVGKTYLINTLIYSGGLSRVYRANCGDRSVVLKILQLDCSEDSELREKFLAQMQVIACIQTKKSIRVIDYGTDFLPLHQYDAELPYIVSELCEFPSLAENLKNNTYDLPGAIALIIGIIKSLQSLYAGAYLRSESGAIIHPVKLWHHNLKPNNIFLGDLFIQLGDFGGYQLLFLPEQGDWHYAAPEDWQETQLTRDERRDVYGCGLILYEILTGKSPYQVPANSNGSEWQRVISTQPIPTIAANLEIPRALELLVLRCLEKEPQHRFSNLKQLQTALEEIAQIPERKSTKSKRSLLHPFYLIPFGAATIVASLIYLNLNSTPQTEIQPKPQLDLNSANLPPTPGKNPEISSEETLEKNLIKIAEKTSEKIPKKLSEKSSEKSSEKNLVQVKSIQARSFENSLRSIEISNRKNQFAKAESQAKNSTKSLVKPLAKSLPPALLTSTIPQISVANSSTTVSPIIVQVTKAQPIQSASRNLSIPVAKRVEPIPLPSAEFFPRPLAQPRSKLIPPPVVEVVNSQDQAVSKQLQLSISVSNENAANFSELLQRGGELATQTINREFALYPQRQELQVAVVGDRNGQEVPLLLAKVNRNEWQKDANIGRWANFIIKSEALLGSISPSKNSLRR